LISKDHKGGGAGAKALGDVGTSGFFADGM